MYEQMKTLGRKKDGKAKNSSSRNRKKRVMYEVDDIAAKQNIALDIGMGNKDAESRVAKRKAERNMPLHERLAHKEAESQMMSEATTMFVKGAGATKEVTYMPKATRSKDTKSDSRENRSRGKRSRRGIKDLGFRTPFKNTS